MNHRFSGPDPVTLFGIAVGGFSSGLKDGFNNEAGPRGAAGFMPLTPAFAYASLPGHVRRAMAQEREALEKFAGKFYRAGVACGTAAKRAFGL